MATKLNPALVGFIAGMMTAGGFTLQGLDENSTGIDDIGGLFLIAGGDVFQGIVQGNEGKLDKGMVAANKVTAQYLRSKGLTPA